MDPVIRFQSQLDDIPLGIEYVNDGCENAYAEYEYADADGSDFEGLGEKARTCSCRAWFYKSTYENFKAFETAITARNAVHNFVHPARGLITGVVISWNIAHDERKACAVVDFVFKEQLQGSVEERITPLIQPTIESLFVAAQAAAVQSLADRISSDMGTDAGALIGREIDPEQSLASQFTDQSWPVRTFVAKVDTAVTAVEGFLTDVEQPANTLISAIDYGTSLPGRVIGAIAETVDRYASLVETTIGSPYMILQSFYNGVTEMRDAITGFESAVDTIRAQVGALLAAQLFAADDDNRGVALTVEKTSAWSRSGEYVGRQASPPVMTVNDLERVLYLVRQHLQTAIDADRSITQHADMAAALLRHVNTIKLERERIVEIDVSTSIPLHLLCHARGLGYNAAERVLTINPQIKNPSFVTGKVSMYV